MSEGVSFSVRRSVNAREGPAGTERHPALDTTAPAERKYIAIELDFKPCP